MSGWLASFRAERHRVLRSRACRWLAAVLVAVPALRVWTMHVLDARARAEAVLAGRSAASAVSSGAGWAPLVDGWRAGLVLGALLLLVHGLRSVAADREQGLLRLACVQGVSRGGLVAGRALLSVLLVLAVVAATGLGALAATSALFDLGPLVEDGFPLASAAELRADLLLAVALALPALLATHAFGVCLSGLSRTAAGALVAGLVLFLGFDLFQDSLGTAGPWVFAAYAPTLVDGSALAEMSGLARGYSDAGFPDELVRKNLLLPWPQALLFLLAAGLAVSRRRL